MHARATLTPRTRLLPRAAGKPFVQCLKEQGIESGIKVDEVRGLRTGRCSREPSASTPFISLTHGSLIHIRRPLPPRRACNPWRVD